jgi:hypothetical protein
MVKIVTPQPAMRVLDEMFSRATGSGELLGPPAAAAVVPMRHDLRGPTSTILPNRPARTSDGRQPLLKQMIQTRSVAKIRARSVSLSRGQLAHGCATPGSA